MNKIETYIFNILKANGLEPVPEYRFHKSRRWRFDLAIVHDFIAIEIEGGTWAAGRHTRGKGYAEDCEKYNFAAICSWCVLRYTTQQAQKHPMQIVNDVLRAIENRDFYATK